ncbi:uncharacterized protein LOC139925454 [Centroberyx gerrardi]
MEDHVTSLDTAATGSGSVAMVTDSTGTDPDLDLRVLCDRVKVLEQNASSTNQPDSHLRNSLSVLCCGGRIRELERSESSLQLQLSQVAAASHLHWPSMQHSQRLDQRLHMLRQEVRTMTQDKERGERVWRERLQRLQNQLKAKEEEMSRQSQYFQNFKTQLQQKLSLARDREQSLQTRVYSLEKQLLDMTVSAATNMATITAVSITAGSVPHREEQERLPSLRGEGEGEEEGEKKKEERRRQWQRRLECQREGRREGDEGATEEEIEGGREKETSSNEARLQGFILSLQEDLRVLLEREEQGVAEQRGLTEQLQEAQESSHFLGCKVEEMKAEVHRLKLSESSLMEEVEELREENQSLREAANQTPSQSSTVPESTCPSPGTSSSSPSPAPGSVPSITLSNSSGKVQLTQDEPTGQTHSAAVPPVHHRGTAESAQNNTEDRSSSAKSDTLPLPKPDLLNLSAHLGFKPNPSLQSLSLATETVEVGEFNLGTWGSRGALNLEESPSEEADALREACRSLGLGEDLEALQEQCDRLESALQHTQEQLQRLAQENARLKLQLRKQAEEQEAEAGQGSSKEQDDLAQALNQENRALAERIRELLAHIELQEGESVTEIAQLREHVSRLEADGAKLEQENQEQGCLITELTRKTEDDLNTIMELQQRLVESGRSMEESQEGCVDSLVDSLLPGDEEPQTVSSQQAGHLTTAPALGSQDDDSLCNILQGNTHVSSLTDQVDQLTKSVQSLKEEQAELSGSISSLREEQREVALSVQTQTEEKQQLTRTVWGLKEERDRVTQSLAGLKQEREQLTRTVCGLKDERDQFVRSMSGLKEEKEQLTKSLSGLEDGRGKLLESLLSEKDERDQIMQSLQSLQKDRDQLSQAVYDLKQERDELTESLECLKGRKDQEQSSYASKEEGDKLMQSVYSLTEEKERIEHSITGLKQEEKQIMLLLQGLREERDCLQAATPHNQSQTEERSEKQQLSSQKKTEAVILGTGECAVQRNQTTTFKAKFIQKGLDGKQEQSDLMREIEALGAELKKSREEQDKTHLETKRLYSELCQSEARREEAERRAAQAANEVMRMTDVADQMEETRNENDNLTTQVKELQSRLTGVARKKADTLSLKAQIEEQFSVLQAQLKAKTVALEELNSEYITLKRGQGSKEDVSATFISLRTRYNDIRAKYDVLLKKKSQTDLDIAPLKAKLSCLVVKCQERNSLLVQMMRAMHRHGCLDLTLTQQVEQLLSDAALQDYTAAFTPGAAVKTQQDYSSGFTPGFIYKLQDYTSGFTPDQSYSSVFPPGVKQQHQNVFTPESGAKHREQKRGNYTSAVTPGSTTNLQDCSREVILAPTGTLKKNANSPVPTSPMQEQANVQASPSPVAPALNQSLSNSPVLNSITQLPPSASGPVQTTSAPERFGLYHPEVKGESSPGAASFSKGNRSSLSPAPPSPERRVRLSRRLSSPEKIINLHEQLQKTMMSSYQAPVSRGRGQQPRNSLSFQTKNQSLTISNANATPLPLSTASSQVEHTPVITTKPVTTNMPTKLFTAVASRSANVTFSPSNFTHTLSKAATGATTTSVVSSSYYSPVTTMAPTKTKSTSSSSHHTVPSPNIPISPKPTRQTASFPVVSDTVKHTPTTILTPWTTTSISNTVSSAATVLICSATNPNTTASVGTAPSTSTAHKANVSSMISKMDGAAPVYNGLGSATSCSQSAPRSPERSSKPARKPTAPSDKTKTARPKPEAPAEVGSVEVIRTVGQSSLMIGWERPPLDELGCSNGTFVYGYRVYVDGEFHKSVMSSACTKCILENIDLSVPVHISVQTLGSNGLSSNKVHTMYRTSIRADHRPSSCTDSQPASYTDTVTQVNRVPVTLLSQNLHHQ